MLRILGRVSSINVRKVLWCADELGLAYEREDWGLPLRDPQAAEFLALNPNAQVPVIEADGFALWESHAIMHYFADLAADGRLVPDDVHQRARAHQWLGWQATDLNASWSYAVMALIRKAEGFDDARRIERSLAQWSAKMSILNAHLEACGPYVTGEAFTLADIALGLSVHRWFGLPAKVLRGLPEMGAAFDYRARLRTRAKAKPYLSDETP